MIVPILCCKRNSVFLLQSIPLRLQSIPLRFQCIQYHSSRKVYFCLSPCAWCKTRQGDAVAGWKYSSLLGGFSDGHSIKCLVRDILHQAQGGFYVFVLSVATGFLWQLLTTLTWVITKNWTSLVGGMNHEEWKLATNELIRSSFFTTFAGEDNI